MVRTRAFHLCTRRHWDNVRRSAQAGPVLEALPSGPPIKAAIEALAVITAQAVEEAVRAVLEPLPVETEAKEKAAAAAAASG